MTKANISSASSREKESTLNIQICSARSVRVEQESWAVVAAEEVLTTCSCGAFVREIAR